MLEERMQPEPGRTREARVVARMPVQVAKRRPVLRRRPCGPRRRRESQFASVSRLIQKDSVAPPAGTAIVRASRLYAGSPACEMANCVPSAARPSERRGRGRPRREGDAAMPVAPQLELAHRRSGQVGRHRLASLPRPRRPAAARVVFSSSPFATASSPGGHGDAERISRLVARMVVDRIPRRRRRAARR